MKGPYEVGYTFGAFDVLHLEHLDHLKEARWRCDYLVVGVWSDEVVRDMTGEPPVNPFHERLQIVRSLRPADVAIGQLTRDLAQVWDLVRFDALLLSEDVPGSSDVPRGLRENVRVERLTSLRRSRSELVVDKGDNPAHDPSD